MFSGPSGLDPRFSPGETVGPKARIRGHIPAAQTYRRTAAMARTAGRRRQDGGGAAKEQGRWGRPRRW